MSVETAQQQALLTTTKNNSDRDRYRKKKKTTKLSQDSQNRRADKYAYALLRFRVAISQNSIYLTQKKSIGRFIFLTLVKTLSRLQSINFPPHRTLTQQYQCKNINEQINQMLELITVFDEKKRERQLNRISSRRVQITQIFAKHAKPSSELSYNNSAQHKFICLTYTAKLPLKLYIMHTYIRPYPMYLNVEQLELFLMYFCYTIISNAHLRVKCL